MNVLRRALRFLLRRGTGAAALADLERELGQRGGTPLGRLAWYAREGFVLAAHLATAALADRIHARRALVVSTLGSTVATALCVLTVASYLEVRPLRPLPQEGVLILALDATSPGEELDSASFDQLLAWPRQMRSLMDVSAFREVEFRAHGASGADVMAMTASGFRLAGVEPLLGRTLHDADEMPGALPVVVLGYDAWRLDFGRAHDVLDRTLPLGGVDHRVVGVMPRGFGFAEDDQYWIPLRRTAPTFDPPAARDVFLLARLAPGATLDAVHDELARVEERSPVPRSAPARLRPRLLPYAEPPTEGRIGLWELALLQFMTGMAVWWR